MIKTLSRPLTTSAAALAAVCLCVAPPALAGEKKPTDHAVSPSPYVRCPSLTTNVMRANGRLGVVTIEAGLDIPDEKLRAAAMRSMPRLRDAYNRALAGIGPSTPRGGTPDLDRVSDAMQKITDQVLGKPGAKFLVGSVIVN